MFPAARARQATTTRRDPGSDPARRPGDDPFAAMFGCMGSAGPRWAVPAARPVPVVRGRPGQLGPGPRHGPADRGRSAGPLGDRRGAAAVRDAVRLAELWLDDATALPSTSAEAEAWSRAEWVEATLPCGDSCAIRSPRASCRRWARRCRPRCASSVRCSASCSRWAARCSAPRSGRRSASSPARSSARPMSAYRSPTGRPARSCRRR